MDFSGIKALTFDCYGTLVDWESGLIQALFPLLSAKGISISEEEVLREFAKYETEAESGPFIPYKTVLRKVMDRFAQTYDFELTPAERDILVISIPGWPLFTDTRLALQKLSTRFQLGILSNIDDDLIKESARKMAVQFSWIITAEQLRSYKPAAANFEALPGRLNLPKNEILHCAQSVFHDCVPASRAGFSTVFVDRRGGIAGGATPVSEFEGTTPWKIRVNSLAELVELIFRSEKPG